MTNLRLLNTVVIVGGGTAGWMAAADSGEKTVPHIRYFNRTWLSTRRTRQAIDPRRRCLAQAKIVKHHCAADVPHGEAGGTSA